MTAPEFVAIALLPFVALATRRHSLLVAAACLSAFFATIAYLDMQYDPLRWIVAALTGALGLFELGRVVARSSTARAVLTLRASWLAALLVGSSCADLVSLHYEAKGHTWGALPIWQIVTCVVMILISIVRRTTGQASSPAQVSALREA
jgi:hypothetical protein